MLESEGLEFPPELALVMACTRWPVGAMDMDDVRRRLSTPIDWNTFLAWVRRNRVTPLAYRNLSRATTIPVPPAVISTLHTEAMTNARRVLMQIAEAARITRCLTEARIRSMMIKGPALSLLAFGDPTLRESQDVDLLIEPARVREADRLIRQAGYQRVIPNFELTDSQLAAYQRLQCQFAYDSHQTGVTQELHWRLTSNPLLMPLDEATVWSRSSPVQLSGIGFATLPDEELFLYLCVHGSGHMWFRLKWIADIAALLSSLGSETIDRIARRARVLNVERSFHVALILANRLLASPVPADALASALQDEAAQGLAGAACKALVWGGSPAEPIDTRWFSTWLNLQAFNLKPGFSYLRSELRIRMFSLDDWAWLPLPKWLLPLYIPMRPFSWVIRRLWRIVGNP
jgi:hypothetical protein